MGMILANARREKHISQELVAELTDVSVETIRNIEHGNTFPRMETVFALWDIYGLPKEDIWKHFYRSNYVDKQMKKLGIEKKHEEAPELTLVLTSLNYDERG